LHVALHGDPNSYKQWQDNPFVGVFRIPTKKSRRGWVRLVVTGHCAIVPLCAEPMCPDTVFHPVRVQMQVFHVTEEGEDAEQKEKKKKKVHTATISVPVISRRSTNTPNGTGPAAALSLCTWADHALSPLCHRNKVGVRGGLQMGGEYDDNVMNVGYDEADGGNGRATNPGSLWPLDEIMALKL